MSDIAATKARLLAKLAAKEVKERPVLDLTPILDYLGQRLSYINSIMPSNILSVREMRIAIGILEQKEQLEQLIERVDAHQNPRHPGPPMNIHILSIYLFPDLYDYAAKYEPSTDCGVSRMYDTIGKVLCNWSDDTYYGN